MEKIPESEIYGDEGFKARLATLVERVGNPNAFAVKCGISQSSVRAFLVRGNPPRRSLLKIASSMQVTIQWLACGLGPMKECTDIREEA